MESLFAIDWKSAFVPSGSLVELILRGTLVYLAIFLFLRVLRRQSGAISITDLVVVVIVADAAQNAMSAEYKSITEGVVLVGTVFFWDYFLDWLAFKVPLVERIVHPQPLALIEDGKMNRRNMRKELITEEDLMSKLREAGVEDVSKVKKAFLEGDGNISVLQREQKEGARKSNQGKKKIAG